MLLVDTHCHLDFPEYEESEADVVERAKQAGVGSMLTIGINQESSRRAIELSRQFPEVYAAIGIHPHDAAKATDHDFEVFERLLEKEDVVALGETGLDFYYENSPKETQIKVLKRFLEMSKIKNLPYIFHVRDAFSEFFEVMKKYESRNLRGVMHCFSGGEAEAEEALRHGLLISFTGILTFKKSDQVREVAKAIPLDKILLETDSPFLAPQSHRGKTNEPSFLPEIAEVLAEVKGVTTEEVAEVTTENCRKLFGFPKE